MPNPVYALQSFKRLENGEFEKDGFLLFPNEARSEAFLEMCEMLNKKVKTCHYEKLHSVAVNEFIHHKVNTQSHFFVRSIERHLVVE